MNQLAPRWGELIERAEAQDVLAVRVSDEEGPFVVIMAPEKFDALLEQIEDLEDAVAALQARSDPEPAIGFDEYLLSRGERVSRHAEEASTEEIRRVAG
ncbi:MAG TPA: hypothetical protein VF707_19925 [Ardenticatenaceae bacterium]|jgi:hypothetical protein